MDLSQLTPLAGGWSGLTFVAEAGGERSVVRLYPPGRRSPAAPEVDAAVLRLVRGLVPVPEVLETRRGDAGADRPGLLVTSWLPGERGDLVLPGLDDAEAARLGGRLGRLAATLAGMPTPRPGLFSDAELTLVPFDAAGDLPAYVDQHAPALDWPAPLLDGLQAVAEQAQDRLDAVGRTCLVHADLNLKNLLVDPATLTLTGVLDWEFAHSGHPYTDLGNLLRFDRRPAYVDAALAAWCELRGGTPSEALDLARAADLWALVDLAARAGSNPVADRSAALLRAIASERDVHALPAG